MYDTSDLREFGVIRRNIACVTIARNVTLNNRNITCLRSSDPNHILATASVIIGCSIATVRSFRHYRRPNQPIILI